MNQTHTDVWFCSSVLAPEELSLVGHHTDSGIPARLTGPPSLGPQLWILSPHPSGRATKEHPPASSTFQAVDSLHPLPFLNVLEFNALISALSDLPSAGLAVIPAHRDGWEWVLFPPSSPKAGSLKMGGKHVEAFPIVLPCTCSCRPRSREEATKPFKRAPSFVS